MASQDEKRSSYRYPVQDDDREAVLVVGRRRFDVRIMDQSAGGFSVAGEKPIEVSIGQLARLENSSGVFETIIIHQQAYGEEGDRLGLQRLRDVTPREQALDLGGFRTWIGSNGTAAIAAVAFIAAAVALSLDHIIAYVSPPGRVIVHSAPPDGVMPEKAMSLLDVRLKEVLRGVDQLNSGKMAERLKLTADQRHSIDQVFDETAMSLRLLHKNGGAKSEALWQQGSARVIQHSFQRVLLTLTDEQIRTWRDELSQTPLSDS